MSQTVAQGKASGSNGKLGLAEVLALLQSDKVAPEVRAALAGRLDRAEFRCKVAPAGPSLDKSGKPRCDKAGKPIVYPALVEVSGPGFKSKRISPRLLYAVLGAPDVVRAACDACTAD